MGHVYLNLQSRRLQNSLGDPSPVSLLKVTLGDPGLTVCIIGGADGLGLPEGAALQFTAKAVSGNLYDGSQLLGGEADVETAADIENSQDLDCEEDWNASALTALFVGQPNYVRIAGQWRWKNADDDDWTKSLIQRIEVENSLFADDSIPGSVAVGGGLLALNSIVLLTGSDATALDNVVIAATPINTWIDVDIPDRGASRWRVTADSGTPVTDTEAGVIAMVVASGGKHLERILGY